MAWTHDKKLLVVFLHLLYHNRLPIIDAPEYLIQNMNAFTYGSLMFPEVIWNLITDTKYEKVNVTLKGYGRRGLKERVYPGLIISPGEEVKGVLYLGLSQKNMDILD